MNKDDLVSTIHESYSYLKTQDIEEMTNALIEKLKEAFVYRIPIEIRGFGSFEVRDYNDIKQTSVIFRPGQKLDKLVK